MTVNDGLIAAQEAAVEFEHINIMEIDPTFKPINEGFYTLQVNKLTPKTITPSKGKNQGKAVLVLNGSFTVVGDDAFSGRKIWKSFWASNPVDLKDLRRLADATGVTQDAGQTLSEYAQTFETLNPPAEFKVFLATQADYRDPTQMVNEIKFNQAQPV